MDWIAPILEQLHWPQPQADALDSEVCALAALALLAHDRPEQSVGWKRLLAARQLADGSVSMWGDDSFPKWTTSLAALAWLASPLPEFQPAGQRAVEWILKSEGETLARVEEIGHDTTLISWPWVAGTHGWVEPTSFCVLTLKAAGQGQHVRVQEATRMLLDRQLPGGGCNYGNTIVLGQELRPHVQPTGIALLALAGIQHPKVRRSMDFLSSEVVRSRTVDSLSWGLLGLAAHGADIREIEAKLPQVWEARTPSRITLRQHSLICLATRSSYLPALVAREIA